MEQIKKVPAFVCLGSIIAYDVEILIKLTNRKNIFKKNKYDWMLLEYKKTEEL